MLKLSTNTRTQEFLNFAIKNLRESEEVHKTVFAFEQKKEVKLSLSVFRLVSAMAQERAFLISLGF